MQIPDWAREFPGAVTVCDVNGIILYMNAKSERTFSKEGGAALLGSNLLDCHPEPARSKLLELMKAEKTNVYTIEKNGVNKLIYQSPWYEGGICHGLVELSLELPAELPHFLRG